MKKFLWIILLCGFLILLACQTTGSTGKSNGKSGLPSWVLNPNTKYNKAQYLVAVGDGDTKKEAESGAYSNISKIFSAEIKSEETNTDLYMEGTNGKDLEYSHQSTLNKNINIKSEQALKNIKVGEVYMDPKTAKFYVLAYLDRFETATIYESDMSDNTEKAAGYYKEYKKQSNKLSKVKYLNKALFYTKLNFSLKKQLDIIAPGFAEVTFVEKPDKMEREFFDAVKEIKINVTTGGKYGDELKKYLTGTLSRLGFSVFSNSGGSYDFVLKGTLDINNVDLERKGEFVRWELDLTLDNEITNTKEMKFTKSGREGHVNRSEAVNRALRTVKDIVGKEVKKSFEDEVLSIAE